MSDATKPRRRSKNRLSPAQEREARARTQLRAAEATRARFQKGDDEDDDGDECWVHCAVACFVRWLDTRQCGRPSGRKEEV